MTLISHVLARLTGRRRPPAPSPDMASVSALAAAVTGDVSRRIGRPCRLANFRATRTGSLTIFISGEHAYVAKLPLRASTEPRLRHNADTLRALGQLAWVTSDVSARCPALVLTGTTLEHFYSVETAMPGRDGTSMLKDGASLDEMLLSAERFLLRLQQVSRSAEPAAAGWQAAFESAADRVETLAKRAGAGTAYRRLVCDITNRLSAHPVPAVYAHGNFWLGNALFDRSGGLTGVIDWDSSDPCSLPALDLIYLLVRTHCLATSSSVGEGFVNWLDADTLPLLDGCMARHRAALELPADLIAPLSYCAWIQHLDVHCRYGTATSADPRWLQRNVRHVVDNWQSPRTRRHDAAHRWQAAW